MALGYFSAYNVKRLANGSQQHQYTIDGRTLSSFTFFDVPVNSNVEYETTQRGQYTNLSSMRLVSGGAQQSVQTGAQDGSGADRQMLIVRQSSIKEAVNLLTHNNPKKEISIVDVCGVAEVLTDYVFSGEIPCIDMPNTKAQLSTDDIPL